jgi:hypothetical protein
MPKSNADPRVITLALTQEGDASLMAVIDRRAAAHVTLMMGGRPALSMPWEDFTRAYGNLHRAIKSDHRTRPG